MLSNSQARNRIEAINELVANHTGDEERSQFKVTPYDVVKKGFIPEEYLQEYLNLMESKSKQINDSPLTLQEQLSYGNYFAMHPEKVCGVMEISSSGAFPVRVKGTREGVERVIGETLKDKVSHVISDLKKKEFFTESKDIYVEITFLDNQVLVYLNFALDLQGRIEIASDGVFQWKYATESLSTKEINWVNIEDKNRIRQYLDNPQIKEFLKAYYPKKIKDNKDAIGNLTDFGFKMENRKTFVRIEFQDFVKDGRVELEMDAHLDKKVRFEKEGIKGLVRGKFYSYESRTTMAIDDIEVSEYLNNPKIKEFLKDYYPKLTTAHEFFNHYYPPVQKKAKTDTARQRRIRVARAKLLLYNYDNE